MPSDRFVGDVRLRSSLTFIAFAETWVADAEQAQTSLPPCKAHERKGQCVAAHRAVAVLSAPWAMPPVTAVC